jgi:hypothetical protein
MARGDLLTRAAAGLVLLVGVFAVADSFRGCDTTTEVRPPPATTQDSTTTTDDGPTPQPEAPTDWPQGALEGVLTFVGADDCRIRTIGLAGGRERPPTRFVTNCLGLWAPKVGSRVAFGELPDGRFFRIADLGHPRRHFGVYPVGADTQPIWSPDGQRLAWCDSPSTGVEREILGQGRILPFCPVAYTPNGDLAHVEGRRLVVGDRTIVRAPKPILYALIGADSWVGVVLEGFDVVRYEAGEPVARTGPLTGQVSDPPIFSPDGCVVAVPLFSHVGLIRLCEGLVRYDEVPGTEASFSPDGRWLAVNGLEGIIFHSMLLDEPDVQLVWPARAAQLAWRSG